MSFIRDKQIRIYLCFVGIYILLLAGASAWLCQNQAASIKSVWLGHDTAIVSSLLELNIPEEVIASAISNTETSQAGTELMDTLGIREDTLPALLPFLSDFQSRQFFSACLFFVCSVCILLAGTFVFFQCRSRLYLRAETAVNHYINDDYSGHLPQTGEGDIARLFSSIDQLSSMLRSRGEAEQKAKQFLKDTISDISHQLKTPLAALAMYQEIIESEPENTETVKEFSHRIGISVKRMERLILAMLKISRLDTGSVIFHKELRTVKCLAETAVIDLTTRADLEQKQIIISGDPSLCLACDMEWTAEALGNLIKNALDHTGPGGIIRIIWERSPGMLRIFVSDNGSGIAPEDIHHIFKRFYRSRHSLDAQGIGLGLPLAKAIVEGQNGSISVRSAPNEGTTFTLSFLTDV